MRDNYTNNYENRVPKGAPPKPFQLLYEGAGWAAQKGPLLAAELLLLLKLLELWAQGVAGVVGHARGHRGVIGRHDGWSRRCLLLQFLGSLYAGSHPKKAESQ